MCCNRSLASSLLTVLQFNLWSSGPNVLASFVCLLLNKLGTRKRKAPLVLTRIDNLHSACAGKAWGRDSILKLEDVIMTGLFWFTAGGQWHKQVCNSRHGRTEPNHNSHVQIPGRPSCPPRGTHQKHTHWIAELLNVEFWMMILVW